MSSDNISQVDKWSRILGRPGQKSDAQEKIYRVITWLCDVRAHAEIFETILTSHGSFASFLVLKVG